METLLYLWHVIGHLDENLQQWSLVLGPWLYVVLFLIVFCETGLVVTPFLPGDSLLFAVGALAAMGVIRLEIVLVLLLIAAILGDAVNYSIGYQVGPRVFKKDTGWLLNKKHLEKTQAFYEKYGGKTIIIARFVPIVRTFAPFVAGIGKMRYARFASYNVVGAVAWVVGFLGLGYLFGNLPFVKKSFHVVIFGIIFVSILPALIEYLRERAKVRAAAAAPIAADGQASLEAPRSEG